MVDKVEKMEVVDKVERMMDKVGKVDKDGG